jgi:LysM repeat protein
VEAKKPASVRANRMPEITLSLPAVLGLLAVFLIVGAVLVFAMLRITGGKTGGAQGAEGTPTLTPTLTAAITATEIASLTPVPTPTTQPPFDYKVATGDTCTSIALAFGVSVQSIIVLNNLPVACNTLSIGQPLKIPYPTPTALPQASATFEPAAATLAACEKVIYNVQANDTLGSISASYAVPAEAIKSYNGLSTDTVFLGMNLTIPLCERAATPGPTPTPTTPPPYPAPNLLLPTDGASFTLANDNITLQWASIGTLRDNESYTIVIEDVTEGEGRRLSDFVVDTKYTVPVSFRPKDSAPHIFRWTVSTVRRTGTDDQGQPIWTSAGEPSTPRVFSWQGVAPEATPKP